jgi:hypothetical protein
MDKKQDPAAAETARTTDSPAVALPQLVRLLPALDMTWPQDRQAQWWIWMKLLFREAEKQSCPLRTITPDGWQPIASVPLGKDVLLHVPFEVGGASRLLTIGMIVPGNYDHGCTHWMPLPSLPNV